MIIAIILIVFAFAIGAMGGTYSANKYLLELTQKRIEDREAAKRVKKYEVYTGTEDLAHFLIDALEQLELGAECEVFTCDGEYFVEVVI